MGVGLGDAEGVGVVVVAGPVVASVPGVDSRTENPPAGAVVPIGVRGVVGSSPRSDRTASMAGDDGEGVSVAPGAPKGDGVSPVWVCSSLMRRA
jgi:hypothetical protein